MNKVGATGNEIRYICPFCPKSNPDTKGHLYVNYIKGVFNCFKCGTFGKLKDLKKKLNLKFIDSPSLSTLKKKLKQLEVKEFKELKLPEDYKLVPPNTEAYNYLCDRGFYDDIIEEYSLGVTSIDNYNTIWFPDFDDGGKLIYYQRRKYKKAHLKDDTIPRWRNPNRDMYGIYKTSQLYNYVRAKQYKVLFVAEGPTSAISLGLNCCGTYSFNWTNVQAKMLASSNANKIYIVFDGENKAFEASMKLCESLVLSGKESYAVRLPDGDDPDSVNRDIFNDCVENAIKFEPGIKNYLKFLFKFNNSLLLYNKT